MRNIAQELMNNRKVSIINIINKFDGAYSQVLCTHQARTSGNHTSTEGVRLLGTYYTSDREYIIY